MCIYYPQALPVYLPSLEQTNAVDRKNLITPVPPEGSVCWSVWTNAALLGRGRAKVLARTSPKISERTCVRNLIDSPSQSDLLFFAKEEPEVCTQSGGHSDCIFSLNPMSLFPFLWVLIWTPDSVPVVNNSLLWLHFINQNLHFQSVTNLVHLVSSRFPKTNKHTHRN